MKPVKLLFLWHMHQPSYLDPATGQLALPWVRLHAARGYTDMARLAGAIPEVSHSFNFTPSLLDQLEGLADGTLTDSVLTLCRKPAADLTRAEREYVLRHFFSVAFEHNVRPLPRYAALLARRGLDPGPAELAAAARAFREADLRDLIVFFHLAWCGRTLRETDERIVALWAKGGGFSEGEKDLVLDVFDEAVRAVLPAIRALSERGSVELSTTPYYHPILPLLCDTDLASRSLPDRPLPPRFSYLEDAREQVGRAALRHARAFGARPRGMWPAEGSVAPEVVPLFEEAGVRWIASDEAVLMRSLPPGARREDALYRPWLLPGGAGRLACFFRDHALSDLIGFVYQNLDAAQAARDFVGHLEAIARAAPRGETRTVAVILDGENAWEHYPRSGWEHLTAIAHALSKSPLVATTTFAAHLEAEPPAQTLPRLHTGSWIDASFRVWIGSAEKNRAWALLGEARRRVAERASDPGAAAAREELLAAEGSDWFWWYGDDFASDQKPELDALFRGRLAAAYKALGEPVPESVREPILGGGSVRPTRAPTALISPELGSPNVLAWMGAGRYEIPASRRAMHGGETSFSALEYGFDLENLYLRLLPRAADWRARIASGEVRVLLRGRDRAAEVAIRFSAEGAPALEGDGAVGAGRGLEARIPFRRLGARPGDEVGIAVVVSVPAAEPERSPPQGLISFRVPDASFDRENWSV
jgi:alpha-amylase/alpha-mannosidase (GH57 family)